MIVRSFLVNKTLRNGMIELITQNHPQKKDMWITIACPMGIYTILQERPQNVVKEYDTEEEAIAEHHKIANGELKLEVKK